MWKVQGWDPLYVQLHTYKSFYMQFNLFHILEKLLYSQYKDVAVCSNLTV